MSFRLPKVPRRFTRKLLRNTQTVATPYESHRVRLELIALEDRVVPTPLVAVSNIADAIEGTSNGFFRFERGIGGLSQPLTVYYTISGSATSGTDYATLTGSVTFEPHDETAEVEIDVTNYDDNIPEFDETITLTISADSAYTIGTDEATVTIHDNETPAVAVVAINDAAEGGTNGKFSFVRMGNTSGSLAVSYSLGGTAINGTDYVSLSGSISFASGEVSKDVNVNAYHDGLEEAPTETAIATITSGTGYTVGSPGTATVQVIDTDILPVAFDGLETTSVNTAVVVDVLDLGFSPFGDTLTVTAVSQGDSGSVSLSGGSATYTPDTDFVGDDSFTYTVEDPFGNESTGTVTITVTYPLAPPTTVWTTANTPVDVAVEELAFDPDGDSMTATAVTQGAHGTVVLNMDGTVTYTPNTNYQGDDSFTYTVEDPDGNEATDTITVTVGDTDPVALDDDAATAVNTPVNLAIEDLAFDPAGDTVEVISVTQGAHGTVTVETDGSITYTPSTNYEGSDTFTYTVEDDDSNTSTSTITVTIGTLAPTEADEVIEDLEGIEDEIENFNENTLETITNALPDIIENTANYSNSTASYISTTGSDPLWTLLSYSLFVKGRIEAYRDLYKSYITLRQLDITVGNAVLAGEALVTELRNQYVAAMNAAKPDNIQIAVLKAKYELAVSIQRYLKIDIYIPLHRNTRKSYDVVNEAYHSLADVLPPPFSLVPAIILPPPAVPPFVLDP